DEKQEPRRRREAAVGDRQREHAGGEKESTEVPLVDAPPREVEPGAVRMPLDADDHAAPTGSSAVTAPCIRPRRPRIDQRTGASTGISGRLGFRIGWGREDVSAFLSI